jgi:hypothetical protein
MKTRKKKFKKENCGPFKRENKFTCYNRKTLHKLKDKYNQIYVNKKINTNDPKHIWVSLKDGLIDKCTNESCWLNVLGHENKDKIKKITFSPKKPDSWNKNPTEWLSNFDIDYVMDQYEHYFPEFKFIGPTPIDFDAVLSDNQCVWEELCKFNLNEYMNKGIKYIGICFNLDNHDQPGSHWVTSFIDIPNKQIYYFDSNGDPSPKEVKKLVLRVMQQGNSNNIKFKFQENSPFVHQKSNTECGMYSLYFIIYMLLYRNFKIFKTHRIPDDEMKYLRTILFN